MPLSEAPRRYPRRHLPAWSCVSGCASEPPASIARASDRIRLTPAAGSPSPDVADRFTGLLEVRADLLEHTDPQVRDHVVRIAREHTSDGWICGRCAATGVGGDGIFSGMFCAPESHEVLDDLGDKVVHALSKSVRRARDDLSEYRQFKPGWVATSTERGLASWIHDRLWPYLLEGLDGIDGVTIKDKEPTREVTVGLRYRIRVKRHHQDGRVSTYPTQTALAFLEQEGRTMYIPSLEEINLVAGYEWDKEARDMGGALLSLRNGQSNIIWVTDLPDAGEQGSGGSVVQPTVPQPTGPKINLAGDKGQRRTEGETRQ